MTQPNSPFANRLPVQPSSPTVANGGHNPADDVDLSDDDVDKQTSFFGSVKRGNSQGAAPVVNSPNRQNQPKQNKTNLFGNDSEEEDDDFEPEGRDDPGVTRNNSTVHRINTIDYGQRGVIRTNELLPDHEHQAVL